MEYLLRKAHDELDLINSNYGNEKELCLCCHSNKADGTGIVHESWCLILELRQALNYKLTECDSDGAMERYENYEGSAE